MVIWGAIGVIVGLLLGVTGAGGAVVAVPLFVYLTGASIRDATALSLIAVLAGSALNWIFQIRSTDVRLALILFFFSALGSIAFRPVKASSPEWLITVLFIAVTGWSLYAVWRKEAPEKGAKPLQSHRLIPASVGGFTLGGLITMTGLGGGVMLVPLLIRVFKASLTKAASTSLLTILLSSSFALWIQQDRIASEIRAESVGALVVGNVLAALGARSIIRSMDQSLLDQLRRRLIALVIALSAIGMITKTFSALNLREFIP